MKVGLTSEIVNVCNANIDDDDHVDHVNIDDRVNMDVVHNIANVVNIEMDQASDFSNNNVDVNNGK